MHEYIPPQQNININISYNVATGKGNKFGFGKKTAKNTKIVPDRDCLDLKLKVPKKAEQITNKLEENRKSLQGKPSKQKKKVIKSLKCPDPLMDKRFKTDISAQLDPPSTTHKKESRQSKLFTKSSSQHYRSLNQATTQQLTSKPSCKKSFQQVKPKKKEKKNHNASCMISFNKKVPLISDVDHIVSTVGQASEARMPRKRINSANIIRNDKMVKKLMDMSVLASQIGGSIPMNSENNRYDTFCDSMKGLNLMMNSIDVRLIKQMEKDNRVQKRPVVSDLLGQGIELISYLNKIKRIPIQRLHRYAETIQIFWRYKVRKNISKYYEGLFKHAASGIKPAEQLSQIADISRNQISQEQSAYRHSDLVQKIQISNPSQQDLGDGSNRHLYFEVQEKPQIQSSQNKISSQIDERQLGRSEKDYEQEVGDQSSDSLSLDINKYRQWVKDKEQEEQVSLVKTRKDKKIQQWNNINKLISINMNEKQSINSKQLLNELMRQSNLHKQWIEDDINGNSQKVSHGGSEEKIIPPKVPIKLNFQPGQEFQEEEQGSYNQYNWTKYPEIKKQDKNDQVREQSEKDQSKKWVEQQIRMENGIVQNYLDCGLESFGLKVDEAIHHNSQQEQQPNNELFSNSDDENNDDKHEEKVFVFENNDDEAEFEKERKLIEQEINVKRKEKVIEDIILKLIEEFAMDVSNILKKTQNLIHGESAPAQPVNNGIITNYNNIASFLTELKAFILGKQEYCDEVVKHLKMNIGPTSTEILTYLRFDEQEGEERQEAQQEEMEKQQEGIFIIPNDLFDVLNENLVVKEEQKAGKNFSKKMKCYLQFWHRSLFECFNQCLDYERPFGIGGAPYAWVTEPKLPKNKHLANLPQTLDSAESRFLELCYSPSGIIFDKPDSPYRQSGLTEECKYQLNEQRVSRMLANQILEDEVNWITYNDEITELLVEIAQMIEGVVLFQAATDLKKITRRRKSIVALQQESSQHAVFHLQQL